MASGTAFSPALAAINNLTSNNGKIVTYTDASSAVYASAKTTCDYSTLDGITLLCIIDRTANYSADVPDYSVENIERDSNDKIISKSFSFVSDSILRSPLTLDVTIFESDMVIPISEITFAGGANRVQSIKDKLLEIADSGKVFEFITPHEVFENMVITSLSFPEDDYLNAMEISISMQQVTFTASTEVTSEAYEYSGTSDEISATIEISDANVDGSGEDDITSMTSYELLASCGVDFDNGIKVSEATVKSFGSYLGTGSGGTQDSYIQKIINAAKLGLLEDCLFFNPNYGSSSGTTYHYVYSGGYFYKTSLVETQASDSQLLINTYFKITKACYYSTEIKTLVDSGYKFIAADKNSATYECIYTTIDDYLATK